MNAAELARLYVIGQAAKLVSATLASTKSSGAQYATLQKKRIQDARAALAAVADLPEVKTVLDKPSHDNARKLADSLKSKDVSAKVKAKLPAKDSYK